MIRLGEDEGPALISAGHDQNRVSEMGDHFDLCRDHALDIGGQRHSAAIPSPSFSLEPGRTSVLNPHRYEDTHLHGRAAMVKCQNMTKTCHVLTLVLVERSVAPTYVHLKTYEANQKTHPQTQNQFNG